MSKPDRSVLGLSALNGLLAVAFGAFGAHALHDPAQKTLLSTASHYQLAAAGVGLALALAGRAPLKAPALLIAVGGLVFGVSIDALALSGVRMLGAITPLGGVAMMAGFALVGLGALRGKV
jgi:uncharacterized membrane protein YgdD (TMEM256/DUF423 family)